MTKLQEYIYQYIADNQFSSLQADTEYTLAQQKRNETEEKFSAGLTNEQKQLFSLYMDEENRLCSIQLRHFFQETLEIVHDILNVSL